MREIKDERKFILLNKLVALAKPNVQETRGKHYPSVDFLAVVEYLMDEEAALRYRLLNTGPKDLEPDNYDDGFAEGVNDANIRWRTHIKAVFPDPPDRIQPDGGAEG